jgi:hypothetical protein
VSSQKKRDASEVKEHNHAVPFLYVSDASEISTSMSAVVKRGTLSFSQHDGRCGDDVSLTLVGVEIAVKRRVKRVDKRREVDGGEWQ